MTVDNSPLAGLPRCLAENRFVGSGIWTFENLGAFLKGASQRIARSTG